MLPGSDDGDVPKPAGTAPSRPGPATGVPNWPEAEPNWFVAEPNWLVAEPNWLSEDEGDPVAPAHGGVVTGSAGTAAGGGV
jgi:hypothetical protein